MRFETISTTTGSVPPATRTKCDIDKDAPGLLPLYEKFPHIVYTLSDPSYKELSSAFNQAISVKPLAVIRASEEIHVADTIKIARKLGLSLGIRSGGSDLAGRNISRADNGIILDIRGLNSVTIADGNDSAAVGGGILSGELAPFLGDRGLFTPIGWHPMVGYVGWAMGGGYGMYASSYGLGVDQILAARLVLADGSIIQVDEDHHPELLWALRGAGNGIWGVVTQLTVKIYPQPKLLIGALKLEHHDWESALTEWSDNIEPYLPVEFAGDLYIRNPNPLNPEVCFYFAWCAQPGDDLAKGYSFLDKMKSLSGSMAGNVSEMDFASFVKAVPSSQPTPCYLRGVITKGLTRSIVSVLDQQYRNTKGIYIGSPSHFAHGLAIQPNPEACFPLRYRHRLLPLICRHDDMMANSEANDAVIDMADGIVDELKATGDVFDGVAYGNLMPSIDTNVEATFGKETLQRLRDLKKTYDPDGFFSGGYPSL